MSVTTASGSRRHFHITTRRGPALSSAGSRAGEGRCGVHVSKGPGGRHVRQAHGTQCCENSSEVPARRLTRRCSARSRCGAQACNRRLMTGPGGRRDRVLVSRDQPSLPRDPDALGHWGTVTGDEAPAWVRAVFAGQGRPRAGSSLSGRGACRLLPAADSQLPWEGLRLVKESGPRGRRQR